MSFSCSTDSFFHSRGLGPNMWYCAWCLPPLVQQDQDLSQLDQGFLSRHPSCALHSPLGIRQSSISHGLRAVGVIFFNKLNKTHPLCPVGNTEIVGEAVRIPQKGNIKDPSLKKKTLMSSCDQNKCSLCPSPRAQIQLWSLPTPVWLETILKTPVK